jgi:hypothetical protein
MGGSGHIFATYVAFFCRLEGMVGRENALVMKSGKPKGPKIAPKSALLLLRPRVVSAALVVETATGLTVFFTDYGYS